MLSKSQVKYIQSLYHKKFRDEQGCFIVEGDKMIREVLSMKKDYVKIIYALEGWVLSNKKIVEELQHEFNIIEPHEMEKISFHKSVTPVLAVIKKPDFSTSNDFKGSILMLDTIQDPGNLGTIIRTADWFGIKNIICNPGTADCFNPKVIQSTMGSIFRVNIIYADLLEVIKDHPHIPVWVTCLNGDNISEMKPPENFFMVIGNESKGVQDVIERSAIQKLSIPGSGNAESLNAAVAAGIVMYWVHASDLT